MIKALSKVLCIVALVACCVKPAVPDCSPNCDPYDYTCMPTRLCGPPCEMMGYLKCLCYDPETGRYYTQYAIDACCDCA